MTKSTKATFTKNDFLALCTATVETLSARVEALSEQMQASQSADEKKELEKQLKANKTKAKYVSRLIAHETLANEIASQVVSLKFSAEQIKDVFNDSYSVAKFAPMMISIAQKRKVTSGDEHVLSEFLAVVASGANDLSFAQFGAKMQNKQNAPYGVRQPQMCAKLLERLNAVSYKKNGNTVAVHFEHDSALGKRLMKAYE